MNTATLKEIPEFYRDLKKDTEVAGLWHFTHRHYPNTKKPIRTEDNRPHSVDFHWDLIFPNKHDFIEVEIGSGKGGFLAEYALKHPETAIIGSEWDTAWAYFAAKRLLKKKLPHAAMLRGDIFYFLRDCVASDTINAFHMYFPDPWPKERHHKNRLLRPEFLKEVARTLKPGKRFFYWGTDHQEYNLIALETFENFQGASIVQKNSALPTDGILTNFEKKYLKEGRPIYRSVIVFEK